MNMMVDLYQAGIPSHKVIRPFLHTGVLTVTGQTLEKILTV